MNPLERGTGSRSPRNTAVIVTEGKTESLYFKGLRERNTNVKVKVPNCSATDPLGIVKHCISFMDHNEKETDRGDLAICVFDADNIDDGNIAEACRLSQEKASSYVSAIHVSNFGTSYISSMPLGANVIVQRSLDY